MPNTIINEDDKKRLDSADIKTKVFKAFGHLLKTMRISDESEDIIFFDVDNRHYKFNKATEELMYQDKATEDWVPPLIFRNGNYPAMTLGNDTGVYYHQFLLSIYKPDDFVKYILDKDNKDEDGSLEINHMVISEDGYHTITGTHADCLEIDTKGKNNAHKTFIKKYGLYGIKVSIKDLDVLEKILQSTNKMPNTEEAIQKVLNYYKLKEPLVKHDYRDLQ